MAVRYDALLAVLLFSIVFFFNDTATTEIYTLSLHDALPISRPLAVARGGRSRCTRGRVGRVRQTRMNQLLPPLPNISLERSEEHTSELQSQSNLVCRLLLEKKKRSGIRTWYRRWAALCEVLS